MNAAIIPSFGTGQAAHAAGLEQRKCDAWLSRHTFRLESNDVSAGGHGNSRRWSLRTVRKLALMASLHRSGVGPARAATWAELCLKRCDYLCDDARHYAAFQNDGCVRVITIDSARDFQDQIDDLIGGADSLVVIDISRLFGRVDERLKSVSEMTG